MPTLVVVVLLLAGRAITMEVANDTARRLSRQYSIEAAANFLASTNSHFALMQQLSRSATVARWFANEHDPELKANAFYEIMGYVAFIQDYYIMFTLYGSLNAYNFNSGLTLDTFTSWGHIGPETHYESRWFYSTRDAETPFFINIQRARIVGENIYMYMWSNSRVYFQDRFVGVVTVGSPFDGVFDATFGAFDVDNKRGYIIDENGLVRVDSALLLQVHELGIPIKPPLPEAADNPALAEHINAHLELMTGGLFLPGYYQQSAAALLGGTYRYGSVAPIIGTNWSVVVLSNDMVDFYGAWRYVRLIPIGILLLALAILFGNVLIHHMAFAPLLKLTDSTMEVSAADTTATLFGLERKDEIGDLSRTIWSFLNKERELLKALEYRTKLLNTVNTAAEILLIADESDNIDALTKGMELMGHSLAACRVQIWLPEEIDGELCFVLQHSWSCVSGEQKRLFFNGSVYPYSRGSEWLDVILMGIRINGPVSTLYPSVRTLFDGSEAESILILPMFLDTAASVGFICIHDCKRERTFSEDEVDMVESAGLMFASIFSKNKQRELAFTDALTGIRNRHYFMSTADQELHNCINESMDFSVIMVDIDHFKSVNDRYGHAVGDEVLKILTARIENVLKNNTLFARYGGEEFVITLPGVNLENALKTAWRLQKNIEGSLFLIKDLEISITASFGVAAKTDDCIALLEIISNADAALYRAKNAGRNTVIGFDCE